MATSHKLASDIDDLIAQLQSTQFASNCAVFDHLAQLVGPTINIHWDSTPVETATATAPATGRYAHLNKVKITRVMLTTNRNKAQFDSLLERQCNGVVIDLSNWKVLTRPPHMFNPNSRRAVIKANFAKYTIELVNDGTVVTLYHWDNKWCMATTNGFDVSGLKWVGSLTYLEAFTEAVGLDFSMDNLDKTKAYTIGFRHNTYHPLLTDPARAWVIKSEDPIGLPVVPKVTFTLQQCDQMNSAAMNQYLSNKAIHYGFILRGDCGADSDILLESSLLRDVRSLFYNQPKRHQGTLTAETRTEYTVLRNYLNPSRRMLFIRLFPQFNMVVYKYTKFIETLTGLVIAQMRGRVVSSNTPLDKLAAVLVAHIEKVKINVLDSNGASVVGDFIDDATHLDLYFNYFVAENQAAAAALAAQDGSLATTDQTTNQTIDQNGNKIAN